MDLDELQDGRAHLTVTYKGQTAIVEYRPESVGMNLQRAMTAAHRPPHEVGPIIDELAKILSAWDLKRAGEALPVTPDSVGSLPVGLMGTISEAIMGDFHDPKSPGPMAAPRPASSMPSPPTSEPGAVLATAPTSQAPSSTPVGPASLPGISSDSQTPAGA